MSSADGFSLHIGVTLREDESVDPGSPLEDIKERIREELVYGCGENGMAEELTADDEVVEDFVKRAADAFRKGGWARSIRGTSIRKFDFNLVYIMDFEVTGEGDEYDAFTTIKAVATHVDFMRFLSEKAAAQLPKWEPFKEEGDGTTVDEKRD